tara:strand:+ start:10127 stop:10636 length:510 start_codon:yes stop_codon:yes gene_type:complete
MNAADNVTTGAWELLSDIDNALDILADASAAYAEPIATQRLIDRSADEPAASASATRAAHAVTMLPVDTAATDGPTVFEYVRSLENPHPMDVQWAVITLLALNASFRERVASKSPRRAAAIVRETPARFERYLIGTPTAAAMTPHEAVCDFVCRVQFAYTGITSQTVDE